MDRKVRLLAKVSAEGHRAAEHLRQLCPAAEVEFVVRGQVPMWHGPVDVLISYLCPWVVPASCLREVSGVAVNFHPGPPEYPGIGCTNYALYDGARIYGVTAHQMVPRVDAGPILAVRRFFVQPEDTVWSLTHRAYDALEALYRQWLPALLTGDALPQTWETWATPARTRSQFLAWLDQDPTPDPQEYARRYRAMAHPDYPLPRAAA